MQFLMLTNIWFNCLTHLCHTKDNMKLYNGTTGMLLPSPHQKRGLGKVSIFPGYSLLYQT